MWDPAEADPPELRLEDLWSDMDSVSSGLQRDKPVIGLSLPLPTAENSTELDPATSELECPWLRGRH